MDGMVLKFQQIAREKWQYLEAGNARKGNRCFDQLKKLAGELTERNMLRDLIPLLDDPEDGVKFEAAAALLPLNLKKTEETLLALSEKRGLIPFNAERTLIWWNEKMAQADNDF